MEVNEVLRGKYGNPAASAALRAGETVLDPGSGGGIGVLLSSRRVGPTGKAYGLDMLWVRSAVGALSVDESIAKLARAGVDRIDIEPTRMGSVDDARAFLAGHGLDIDSLIKQVEGKFMSAFIRAGKALSPAALLAAAPGCQVFQWP